MLNSNEKILFSELKTNLKNLKIVNKNYVYYQTKTKWNKELQHSIDDRCCIGKKIDDYFIPNKKYYSLFPKPIDNIPDILDCLSFGPYLALLAASMKYGCYDILKLIFPNDYDKIFTLAISYICNEDSTAQHFENWAFKNYCGLNNNLSSPRISELYSRITEDQINDFLGEFLRKYKESNIISTRRAIAYDSTNQNTTANIRFAEIGHAKEDKKIPIINTCYLVDEYTGITLYYEHYYGSLLDKTECVITYQKVKGLGFKKLFFMLDRGYFSSKNIEDLANDEF